MMIVRGAAVTSSGRSFGPATITLKDLVRATRRPLTAKQRSSANELMHKPRERANGFGSLSVRLGASAGFHILSLSIHSTASLWPKIILYKWMDFDFHVKFGTKNCTAIINLNLGYLEQYIFFNVSLCRVGGDSLCFIEPERRRTRNVRY